MKWYIDSTVRKFELGTFFTFFSSFECIHHNYLVRNSWIAFSTNRWKPPLFIKCIYRVIVKNILILCLSFFWFFIPLVWICPIFSFFLSLFCLSIVPDVEWKLYLKCSTRIVGCCGIPRCLCTQIDLFLIWFCFVFEFLFSYFSRSKQFQFNFPLNRII